MAISLWCGDRFLARHQHAVCRSQQTAAAKFTLVYHHVVAIEEHQIKYIPLGGQLENRKMLLTVVI